MSGQGVPEIWYPTKGAIRVKMPFRPGGENYGLLHAITGNGSRKPKYVRGAFELPRSQYENVVLGLVKRFGSVAVLRPGVSESGEWRPCSQSCMGAASPDWRCECACGGLNHRGAMARVRGRHTQRVVTLADVIEVDLFDGIR